MKENFKGQERASVQGLPMVNASTLIYINPKGVMEGMILGSPDLPNLPTLSLIPPSPVSGLNFKQRPLIVCLWVNISSLGDCQHALPERTSCWIVQSMLGLGKRVQ